MNIQDFSGNQSPPSRGAWIEILNQIVGFLFHTSPPSRGAWIEIDYLLGYWTFHARSPPSRGAWIEMSLGEVVTAVIGCRPPRGGRGLKS